MRRKEQAKTLEPEQGWDGRAAAPCVGMVVSTNETGDVMVDYPGNVGGPVRARVAADGPFDKPRQPVLLVFEDGDPTLPVITGAVRERPNRDTVTLEAKHEITLVCGKSSVTLCSDGRVIVKGAELLTRATGTNRIRGASVQIN